MNELKKIFKKQGGIKLIYNYIRNGTLLHAIFLFFFLGKTKRDLEILRLSIQSKNQKKLSKKYMKVLQEFDTKYDYNLEHNSSNKIWICWFQGIENAPEIVKTCYQSIKANMPNKEIVLITRENLETYVQFPEYIIEKWKKGIITNTHMTDLLRLELLIKYGGMWLDATVLCTKKINDIPEYYFKSDLFLYQCLKPGKDGHALFISSWFISAKSNNKVLVATRDLCYEYWKKHNYMVDYFLLHHFLCIVLEFYKTDWKNIIPVSNSTPHILLLQLFEKYDENKWRYISDTIPFHKLSYKFSDQEFSKKNTYYQKIILKK